MRPADDDPGPTGRFPSMLADGRCLGGSPDRPKPLDWRHPLALSRLIIMRQSVPIQALLLFLRVVVLIIIIIVDVAAAQLAELDLLLLGGD